MLLLYSSQIYPYTLPVDSKWNMAIYPTQKIHALTCVARSQINIHNSIILCLKVLWGERCKHPPSLNLNLCKRIPRRNVRLLLQTWWLIEASWCRPSAIYTISSVSITELSWGLLPAAYYLIISRLRFALVSRFTNAIFTQSLPMSHRIGTDSKHWGDSGVWLPIRIESNCSVDVRHLQSKDILQI